MTDRDRFRMNKYGDGESDLTTIDDPTSKSFKIFFYFAENSGLLGDENQPNTAANYLKRNRMDKELNYLNKFKDLLSRVSSETPYVFLNVAGIDTGILTDLTEVSSEGQQLIITCRETRLRPIQALIKLYKFACFDIYNAKKEIVPINLRRFSMGIYLTEFGVEPTDNLTPFSAKYFGAGIDDIFLKNHNFFEFGQCEFNLEQGVEYFSEFSNVDVDYERTIDLLIDFKTVAESGVYRGLFDEEKIQGFPLAVDDVTQSTIDDANAPATGVTENLANQTKNQTREKYSVKPINPKLLQPVAVTLPDSQIQNAQTDKLPSSVNRLRGNNSAFTELEKQIVAESQARIRGALSKNLPAISLGNVTGLSTGQLKEDIKQIKEGNISNLFDNVKNYGRLATGNHMRSLENAVGRITTPMSATEGLPSLNNFVRKTIRGQ